MEERHDSTESCTSHDKRSAPKAFVDAPDVRTISVDKITVGRFCQRTDSKEALRDLADSIDRRGLIQFPTVVDERDGTYTLIGGRRRYLACKDLLGWQELPCHVASVTPDEAALLSFSENAFREDPNPVEEARLLRMIKDATGMTDADLAAQVGYTQSGVTERLSILCLPEVIRDSIGLRSECRFMLSHGVQLARLMRTDRPFLEAEAQGLYYKVVRCRLSSSKLGRLVNFIRDGEYDELPERLRALLLENEYMPPAIAELYLHPENAVQGQGKEAEALRQVAAKLEAKDRERFVLRMVKRRLSDGQAKKQLHRMLTRQLRGAEQEVAEGPSLDWRLRKAISALMDELGHSRYHLDTLVGLGPEGLATLCRAGDQLMGQWRSFVEKLEAAGGGQAMNEHNSSEQRGRER